MVTAELYSQKPSIEYKDREPEFGAFIQVFVKKGENIGCLSYPLPPGITTETARRMLTAILYPDKPHENDCYYQSSDGDLQFLARPGIHDIEDRYLRIPQIYAGIDQSEREIELSQGVRSNFINAIKGIRHESAQNSPGKNIFDLSYRVDGGVWGIGVNGQPVRLSQLAMEGYDEHKKMLSVLEQALLSKEDVTIINFDKSKTVSMCCAKFFKDKLRQILGDSADVVSFGLSRIFALYTGHSGELSDSECSSCGRKYNGECDCKRG